MGCTPSASTKSSSDPAPVESEASVGHDEKRNNNNGRTGENHVATDKVQTQDHKTGWGWRKKGHKTKEAFLNSLPKGASENCHTKEATCAGFTLMNKSTHKVLLVFPSEDSTATNFSEASEKLGYDWVGSHTTETAFAEYSTHGHDIVVIDTRDLKILDGVGLCRKMRQMKWGRKSIMVAVVKKSYFAESSCLHLLNAGFNRCLPEPSHTGVVVNELIQIEGGDVRLQSDAAPAPARLQALQTALSRCRDLVQITDETFRVQFVNAATERYLGVRGENLKGRPITELHHTAADVPDQVHRGEDWHGSVTYRRRSSDSGPATLPCRIVASVDNGAVTNYIFIQDPLASTVSSSASKDLPPRGSVPSIRKGSYDVKSLASESGQSIRRQSLAKLNSLPIEAPITKIITLLYAAHEQSTPSVQQQIEKVVDYLRCTELYSPQLKENRIRPDDPITTDLISALLSQGNVAVSTTRRSSNDSANVKTTAASRPSLPSINVPGQLTAVLQQALDWEFDIFQLEELSNHRPLVWLGMNLMCHFNVHETLGCDERTLMNWLTVVEKHYVAKNPYHTSTHAADVMQAAACYMKRDRLQELLDPLDTACVLIAACCHDVDHPGRSSAFLSHSDHDLAILYNDISVLESHHASLTFKLTLADDRINIFKGLERDTYKVARQSIIDMILATEMTKHMEHLTKFLNVFPKPCKDIEGGEGSSGGEASGGSGVLEGGAGPALDMAAINTPENIELVRRMLIKCADVSNPTRPLRLCVEWARRIAEEYFDQTDEEKSRGLPVVMPMFDRTTCSIPISQIGFVDYIITGMMEAWEAFIDQPEMLYYLRSNYQFWKEKEEEGVTKIDELLPLCPRVGLLDEADESKGD